MQNIKLTLQYDGTRYAGWQKPEKEGRDRAARTVSAKLQSALGRITGEIPELYAGARTEPGVHALEQTISFCTGSTLSPAELKKALNGEAFSRRLKRPGAHLSVPDLHRTRLRSIYRGIYRAHLPCPGPFRHAGGRGISHREA